MASTYQFSERRGVIVGKRDTASVDRPNGPRPAGGAGSRVAGALRERNRGLLKIWYTVKPQNYPKLLFLMGKIMEMDWSWEHQGPFWELSL